MLPAKSVFAMASQAGGDSCAGSNATCAATMTDAAVGHRRCRQLHAVALREVPYVGPLALASGGIGGEREERDAQRPAQRL
jgi:hypothetical protein